MSDRHQPDLSTAEGTSYRRAGAARGGKKSGGGSGVGRQIGANMVMAILVAGLVLAGWFIVNQQQQLVAGQLRVDNAEQRLQKLEARLSATDDAMAQGGEDTSEKINLWESEIRKLWAVANERNKNWIQGNQQSVKKLTGSLGSIQAANRDLRASVGRHEKAFDQQQALVDQLTSLGLQMQQVVRNQRDLVDKVNASGQSVASLRAGLAGKVDDNVEAIRAIDAYRVEVNARLADMERRLPAAPAPAAPGQL